MILKIIFIDILILLLYFFYAIHYKISAAYKKNKRRYCFRYSVIAFVILLISPYAIPIKWAKNGDLEKQSKQTGLSKAHIILLVFKTAYINTASLIDSVANGLACDTTYSKFRKTVCIQQETYSNFIKKACLA